MKNYTIYKMTNMLKAIIIKRKVPLFIAWAITYRCNKKCLYCRYWQKQTIEFSTEEVIDCILKLKLLGTWGISFTGGEPLLRADLPEIIHAAVKNGIFVKIDTNGSLIPARIKEIKNINMVSLSFDGPQEVHDKIRGEGSFDEVMIAIDALKTHNIKMRLITVLSRENYKELDYILGISKKYKIYTMFQIASKYILGLDKTYNLLSPEINQGKEVISKLISAKSRNKYIMNSLSALKYCLHFPHYPKIECLSSRVSCRIEPDGNTSWCGRVYSRCQMNIKKDGLKSTVLSLPVIKCDQCSCADRLELNYILKGDLSAILNQIRISFNILD